MRRIILITATTALAAACAPVEADEDFVSDGPPVKVLGEAESCISLSALRQSKVRDDRTIDFEMAGGKTYRNTLPNRCPRLGFEEGFSYSTSLNRLCNTDIIYVLENFGGQIRQGAGCGLGKFVPVEYVEGDEE
ncbi:hypothetical protein [Altererythrobacter sp. GH1-8]|uniref:hypothetical protein n=1 Tax=Altererythrobacter sp. GH1-8 TaxID=3349333 RepID=UPI00374D0FF2